MIRYFRINDPYRLVGLFILLLIIYLPLFIYQSEMTVPELKTLLLGEKQNEGYRMYRDVVDNSAPLAAGTHEVLDSVFGRSIIARHILAFVIIFLQSAYIGVLFITKRVFAENTFIPSFIFALLFFFSYDTLSLTNELLGSSFLLLALNNLFEEIEFRHESDESIFNVGLCISLASLFAFSFVVYLICALLILLLFTRSSIRKYLLLVFGFLLPHLLALSVAYLNGSAAELWKYFYLSNLTFERTAFVSTRTLLYLGAIPLVYFLISLVILNREARFSKYQTQIVQVIFLWLAFSILFTLYSKDLRPQTLIVFIPGLALLLTHFFLLIRRKKFVTLNSWLLFAGIVAVAYLSRFDRVKAIDYSKLRVKPDATDIRGQRLLILDDAVDPYYLNHLATPFLDWRLSQKIFQNADYYGNVTRVYHSFKNDPPAVVLDSANYLKDFFERMPEIKAQYTRQGNRYVRISN